MCTTTNVRRKLSSFGKSSVEGISPTSYLPSTSPSCLHHFTHPENLCVTISSVAYHDLLLLFHLAGAVSPMCPWTRASSCGPMLLTACPACPSGNPLHQRHHSPSSNLHSGHCSKFISRKEIKHCAITALITNSINMVLSVACPRDATLEVTFTVSRGCTSPRLV